MTSRIETINDLLHRKSHTSVSLPITPPPIKPPTTTLTMTSSQTVDNQQNSTENLRICIKHTQKEYFFTCPEKICMHQVENDKHKIKDHFIEFHYQKACSWNILEDNNVFCYYCAKCNRYTVSKHYHCPHCPKWDLTTFRSEKELENTHISKHFELIKQKPLDKWTLW
jgi:hypothetical protein